MADNPFEIIISLFVLVIILGVLGSYLFGVDSSWVVDLANSLAVPVVILALILGVIAAIRGGR